MIEYPALRNPNRRPTHPGELISDILPDTGRTLAETALALDMPAADLLAIVEGRAPITPEIAGKIGKLYGNGPGMWLRMQDAHDKWPLSRTDLFSSFAPERFNS